MRASPRLRAPLWLALALALALSALVACDGPTPEQACAAAGQASPGFNVNLCVADLRNEKEHDPSQYDADVKCLYALRTEGSLQRCLANPRALLQVQQERAQKDRTPQVGAVLDPLMGKLRDAVRAVGSGDPAKRAAVDKLLDQATTQQKTVADQLGGSAPEIPSTGVPLPKR